jgi:integrase
MRKVVQALALSGRLFAELNAVFGGPHGVKGLGYLYQPRYRDKKTRESRSSSVWWWDPPGKHPRVSTGCRDKQDARAWTIQRLGELGRGSTIGLRARALTFDDLCRMIEDDYKAKGNRSGRDLRCRLKFLRAAFGGRLATEIPDDAVTAYVARRRETAAVATINMELKHLRRMFRLARKRIPRECVPEIDLLKGEHVRRDILSDADLDAILEHLPAHHAAAIEGLRETGWREDEILALDWPRVDFASEEIRLDTSKDDEPRSLSFAHHPRLKAVLVRQEEARAALQDGGIICPWVFFHGAGRRISTRALQQAWGRARVAAGAVAAEGPFIHGLRRKLAKELLDAGNSEADAMKVTGHRTANTFRRYAIRDRRSQERALDRLQAHREAQAADPERDRRKIARGTF